MRKFFISLLLAFVMAFTVAVHALTPIATNDPVVGTWIGVGIDRQPDLLGKPSGGWGNLLLICYIWGGAGGSQGVCNGVSRNHDDSGFIVDAESWPVYAYKITPGVYVVNWNAKQPLNASTMVIMNPEASTLSALFLQSSPVDRSGLVEFSQYYRAPEGFDLSAVQDFLSDIPRQP